MTGYEARDDAWEALDFLNELNESGRIEYDDYLRLHEFVSVIAWEHPEPEIPEATVFDVVSYDDDGEKIEGTWITKAEAAAYITGRTVSLTSPSYFAGWGIRERRVPVGDFVSGEGEQS